MSAHSSKLSEQDAAAPAEQRRGPYSSTQAYRPLRRPETVEDKDACALYAAVRKDGRATHDVIEKGFVALQKMLHRAGNVDGEGDGCGAMIDIPRLIWQEEVRAGGHAPRLALDPAFAVAHIFVSRAADFEQVKQRARQILHRNGLRVLAEREDRVSSAALGPTAREEEPHFWQIGVLVPDAEGRDRILFDVAIEIESTLDAHVASLSAESCVYKVMGAPLVLQGYFEDLSDPRCETVSLLGHNRYSTNTWPSFMRVQPFSVLGHNGEINTVARLRAEARMLGVPIRDDSSDSQDMNRMIETLIHRRGLSLPEAMELAVPPIVNEIRQFPEALRGFYMYLRQAMGPFAQGPIALIARNGDEYVFSVDALGLRPLWEIHAEDAYVFSSEPGVVPLADMTGEPKPLSPGEKVMVRVKRDKTARLFDHQEMQKLVHKRWLERTGAEAVAGFEQAIPTGGPLEGPEIPGYDSAGPVRAGQGRGEDPGRHGMAARGHEARAADGIQRSRADRVPRLRRTARVAVRGAPEPGRLLQGDGRRRHQPGDRPRARDRAFLVSRGVRRATLDRRPAGRRRARSRPPSRSSSAVITTWLRCPTRSTGPSREGHKTFLLEDLWECLPRALGRDRHLVPGGRDRRGRARAAQVRGREEGARRLRAAGALGPHGFRRRAAVDRPASRARRHRSRAARVPRRAGRGEPAPAHVDRPALGGDPQRARRLHGARARRRRRLSRT